jgi:hypothetical protein
MHNTSFLIFPLVTTMSHTQLTIAIWLSILFIIRMVPLIQVLLGLYRYLQLLCEAARTHGLSLVLLHAALP